eukprot:2287350-Pleurochrysis_carterae.AAC.3
MCAHVRVCACVRARARVCVRAAHAPELNVRLEAVTSRQISELLQTFDVLDQALVVAASTCHRPLFSRKVVFRW